MAAVQDPIEKLQRRLRKLEQLKTQRETIAKEVIEEVTVEEIKTKMYSANYSIRIIDNVHITNVRVGRKRIKFTIRNELIVGNGFDIALGRERGIRPHDIFGNPLAWEGVSIIGTPSTIFATHVKHPGVQATHIIRDTVREKSSEVEERYRQRILEKIQAIKNSS